MSEAATPKRAPVTVVCVFNDPEVRMACLDRSLRDLAAEAPDLEYIPVDNTGHAHATAGDALNHGARMARHPVVVFVHQDVYLHSLRALEEAAALLLEDATVGIIGAVGVDPSERLVGRIRDRVVLTGAHVRGLVPADSLDEVLFMVRRVDVLAEPLATHPDLAWHAYAVEYGLRQRRAGRLVRVADLPLTHNSLTINLARLDVAHRRILSDYPGLVPVATTCGPIPAPARRGVEALRGLRSSARWVRQSVAVRRALRDLGVPVVLADLTRDVDQLVGAMSTAGAPVAVVNVDPSDEPLGGHEPLVLTRLGQPVEFHTASPGRASTVAHGLLGSGRPVIVTNLDATDVRRLRGGVAGEFTVGYHPHGGFWAVGAPTLALPAAWRVGPGSLALGLPPRVAGSRAHVSSTP